MKTITFIIVLQLLVTLITGCSLLEDKFNEQRVLQNSTDPLVCEPEDAQLCVGWIKEI